MMSIRKKYIPGKSALALLRLIQHGHSAAVYQLHTDSYGNMLLNSNLQIREEAERSGGARD